MKKANLIAHLQLLLGDYCLTQAPFGLAAMSKIFNRYMAELIKGLVRWSGRKHG